MHAVDSMLQRPCLHSVCPLVLFAAMHTQNQPHAARTSLEQRPASHGGRHPYAPGPVSEIPLLRLSQHGQGAERGGWDGMAACNEP